MEFKPPTRAAAPTGVHVSQIYLVEFKPLYGTIYYLVPVWSQIYLVEFKRLLLRAERLVILRVLNLPCGIKLSGESPPPYGGGTGLKSTLWN